MTKHAVSVWSTTPPSHDAPHAVLADDTAAQAALDADPARRALRDRAVGPATVATYSVVHGRDGAPAWGLVVCDLPEGDRCSGRVLDPDLLGALEAEEWVGRAVVLRDGGLDGHDGVNVVRAP